MPVSLYNTRLAEILLGRGLVAPDILESSIQEVQASGLRLERYLVENNIVTGAQMTLALSEYLHMAPIRLRHFTPPGDLIELIGRDTANTHIVIPLSKVGQTITVALGDPFDLTAIDAITAATGLDVTPVVAPESEVRGALSRYSADSSTSLDMAELMQADGDVEVLEDQDADVSLDEMLESAEGAPVIRMVNMILVEALRTNASDIHIEPMERKVRLRYRVDGVLVERPGPPKNLQAAVVSRVKIMADLDIAERRVPQDGRFNIKALGREIDLRVSVLPTVHGEKVVMRTLDKSTLAGSLSELGLDPKAEASLSYGISQPHGIILVTGPTGSGKTTTLYSCLQDLNRADVNIITCEDPVEYQLEGINQVQINTDIGLTFAASLRSILRQDPDIVLVGEIRDQITAEIAVRAALTGHLVLSTLHTNDAAGAVTRMVDMEVEPFMLSSCLVLAQAQRLYRRLCSFCKRKTEIASDILEVNNINPEILSGATIFEPVGCPRCSNGFKGRGAIMEVMLVSPQIREAILHRQNASVIRDLAIGKGMMTLKDAGLARVREGLTSLEAALAVTGGE